MSVWKALVATWMCVYVCVWLMFKHVFSVCWPPALKYSTPARNPLVSSAKSVCLQHNKHVRLETVDSFRNPLKRIETRENTFWKTLFQVGMDVKIAQKQGRDGRTQEDCPKSDMYFCRCRVAFLCPFTSALFLSLFQVHPYLKWSSLETFFLVVFEKCMTINKQKKEEQCIQ